MTEDPLVLTLPFMEGHYLADLLGEYLQVVNDPASSSDDAVSRLTPDIYPDDREASAAFRDAVHDDLLERRRHDAHVVLATLRPFTDDTAEGAARAHHDVHLGDTEIAAWMRTLSAVRLIMAERLGVATTDSHDPDDQRFGVYDWLGYRLDQIVMLADARDDDAAS